MAVSDAQALASDFPFAKVVATKDGDALLIGGKVFTVHGPDGNSADLFASALRSGPSDTSGAGEAGVIRAASAFGNKIS